MIPAAGTKDINGFDSPSSSTISTTAEPLMIALFVLSKDVVKNSVSSTTRSSIILMFVHTLEIVGERVCSVVLKM